jgi:hypothetical protein
MLAGWLARALLGQFLLVAREQPGPGHGQLCPTKPTVVPGGVAGRWPMRWGNSSRRPEKISGNVAPILKTEACGFRQPMRLTWHARIQKASQPARLRSRWSGSGVRAPGRFPCGSSPLRPGPSSRRAPVPPSWPGGRASKPTASPTRTEPVRTVTVQRRNPFNARLFPAGRPVRPRSSPTPPSLKSSTGSATSRSRRVGVVRASGCSRSSRSPAR